MVKIRSRNPAHRVTTAHLQAAYPLLSEGGLGGRGVYIGRDLHGGGSFCYDPWELYQRGLTGPNMLVIGQLGQGKSSFVKTYVWRQLVFGRTAFMLDPKGENEALCHAVGVQPVRLRPGGSVRLNPLDPRIGDQRRSGADIAQDQLTVLQAIVSAVLQRVLTPEERAGCELALDSASRDSGGVPTLARIAEALLTPDPKAAAGIATTADHLAAASREAALELRRLVKGDLSGMFDGTTSADIDLTAPLVSLDLHEVYKSEALGILMVCAASWLSRAITGSDAGRKIVVLDEAWAVLSNLAIGRWLQSNFKLARAYGVQNIAVVHRLTDLRAAGGGESEQTRLAEGLLSDSETQVIYRQAPGDVAKTRDLLNLTSTEADLIARLPNGIALWRVGQRSFLVEHRLAPAERPIIDTDARMAAGTPAATV